MSTCVTRAAWTCLALPYFNFSDSLCRSAGVPSENDTPRDLPIKSPGDLYHSDAQEPCRRRAHTHTRYRVTSDEQEPWIKPECMNLLPDTKSDLEKGACLIYSTPTITYNKILPNPPNTRIHIVCKIIVFSNLTTWKNSGCITNQALDDVKHQDPKNMNPPWNQNFVWSMKMIT